MKNNKLTFLKIAIVAVLGVATILGCEKKEVAEEKKMDVVDLKEAALINELKMFMSELTGFELKTIEYNPQTQYFVWKDVNQITKEQLLLAYEQSKNTKSK